MYKAMSTDLSIKLDEDISTVSIESGESNFEIWFPRFEAYSVGRSGVPRRNKTCIGLTVYLGLSPVEAWRRAFFRGAWT